MKYREAAQTSWGLKIRLAVPMTLLGVVAAMGIVSVVYSACKG